jgi:hypothetical protein
VKDLYNKIDIELSAYCIAFILVFLTAPIVQIYYVEFSCNEVVVEDKPLWLHILAIDWFLILIVIVMAMIGMLLTKVHNYLTKKN